jgi:signal peptidase
MRVRPILKFFMLLTLMGCVAVVAWAWGSGYRVYTVRTGSMEPAYHVGDAVLVRPIKRPAAPGEVITFRPSASIGLVTHRVVSVDGEHIVTKGDANETVDNWDVAPSMVVGRVVGRLPNFGYVFVFLKQSVGVGGLVASLLAILLLWQLCFPEQKEPEVTVTVASPVPLYVAKSPEPTGVEYAVTQDAFGRRHVLAVNRREDTDELKSVGR